MARHLVVFAALIVTLALHSLPSSALVHRVLFVGNSYSASNAPNQVSNAYKALVEEGIPAFESVEVVQVTGGGYTFAKHFTDAKTPGSKLNDQLAVPPGSWDVVVLQEQSQMPGLFGSESPYFAESLSGAIGLDQMIAATGARTMFFLTWGRRDGDKNYPELYPDFPTMQELLTQGVDEYAKETATADRTTYISPVGAAFSLLYFNLIESETDPLKPGSLFNALYAGDGSHPGVYGSYLSALVFYAAITGRSPVGLTWKPAVVTPSSREALQQLAHDAVLGNPFDPFLYVWGYVPRYSWVQPWADALQTAANGEHFISSPYEGVTGYIDATETSIPSLALGIAAEDGIAGTGRLGILDGGSLTVDGTITVGGSWDLSATGVGLLEVRGGHLTAGTLRLANSGEAKGTVGLSGGVLDVGSVEKGAGAASLKMSGGELRTTKVAFSWEQEGGTWTLPVDGSNAFVQGDYSLATEATLRSNVTSTGIDAIELGKLQIFGDLVLRGTVIVDSPGGLKVTKTTTVDVIVANSITAPEYTLDLPPGTEGAIVDTPDGKQALQMTIPANAASPVTFVPAPGTHDAPLTITLKTEGPSTIHYTTDGSSVSQDSPSAPSPFVLELNEPGITTLRALAVNEFGLVSASGGGTYQLLGPPQVIVEPPGGEYSEPVTVTLSADRDDVTLYYTLDGSDPSQKAATIYDTPLTLDSEGEHVVKARAVTTTGLESAVRTETYIIGAIAPPVPDDEPDTVSGDTGTAEPDTSDASTADLPSEPPAADSGGCTQTPAPAAPYLWLLLIAAGLHRRLRFSV